MVSPRTFFFFFDRLNPFSLPTHVSGPQMVRLRSKLHLSRQAQKPLSSSRVFCPAACNAPVPTQPADPPSMSAPTELPSSSPAPKLGTLPEELLIRVASFCDFGDILRLRRSSRALHYSFGSTSVIEQVLLHLVSPFSTFFTPAWSAVTSSTLHVGIIPRLWVNPGDPSTLSLARTLQR